MVSNPLADEPCRFYSAYYFPRKNVNLAGLAILDIEDSTVVVWVIFDHTNGETRSQIHGVFSGRDDEAAVLLHRFEAGERNGTELTFIQEARERIGNGFGRISGSPMIGILGGAEQ